MGGRGARFTKLSNPKRGMTAEQTSTVITLESIYRNKNIEYIFIVNSDGKIVAYNKGDEISVKIPDFQKAPRLAVIHNHPKGGTFSPKDIEENGKFEFKWMSVPTKNATYVLIHQGKDDNIRVDSFNLALNYKKFSDEIIMNFKQNTKRPFIKSSVDNLRTQHHEWLQQHAQQYNFKYLMEEK